MSKLSDKTINTIVANHIGSAVNNPKDKNNPVHRIMAQGHELPDIAQRRMLLYGNEKHVEHVLNQPKMTHSTVWLAHGMIDNFVDAAKTRAQEKKYDVHRAILKSNFPKADDYHAPQHVHINANKPK